MGVRVVEAGDLASLPVADLLASIKARGITLAVRDGNVWFRPKQAVPEDIARVLKRRKHEILAAFDGLVLRPPDPAQMRAIEWVRPGRWPRGYLVNLVGDPGLGKSLVTIDAAARLSAGLAWPEGGTAPRGMVLILSAEDGLEDVITPRLVAAGADVPDKVRVIEAVQIRGRERHLSLAADLDHLEAAIIKDRPVAIIIDPVSAYLGEKVDSNVDAAVRAILAPLARLARKYGVLILAVMHLNKGTAKALYRVSGSIGFVGQSRATFAVLPDPEAPAPATARRFMVALKANYAEKPPPLAFTVGPATAEAQTPAGHVRVETAVVTWENGPAPRVDVEAAMRAVVADVEDQEARRDAAEWLSGLLGDVRVPVTVIQAEAEAARIGSWRTVERAKAKLRVKAERTGAAGGEGYWTWRLPETPRGAPIVPEPKGKADTGAGDAR